MARASFRVTPVVFPSTFDMRDSSEALERILTGDGAWRVLGTWELEGPIIYSTRASVAHASVVLAGACVGRGWTSPLTSRTTLTKPSVSQGYE